MRIVGPASMGFLTTAPDYPVRAVLAPTRVAPGGVSISLQSGPLGTGILELAARLRVGMASFVSLGDKADVSGNDLLQFWEDDPATKVVLIYTESFGNPRKFSRIARRVSQRKPIVAVRAGGSLDPITEALYEQAGVIRVRTVRELFDTARVLDGPPLPRGNRVMVVSNAVSPAILALDAARVEGLAAAELGVDVAEELLAPLPAGSTLEAGVLQLTYRAMPVDYGHAVRALLAADEVDALVVIFAPPLPDLAALPAAALLELEATLAKPVVTVMVGLDDGPLAEGSHIPVFAFPEPAVAALGRVARHVGRHRSSPIDEPRRPDGLDVAAAREIVEHALAVRPEGTALPLSTAEALLRSYGVSVSAGHTVTSTSAAADAAEALGYPVALKAAGIVRRGRSERAGVALDLHDAAEVRRAWVGMAEEMGAAAMVEVVVQTMAPPGVELRVAVESHHALGPVVTFGLGGVLADAIDDRVPRLVPFATGDAAAIIAASRASRAMADEATRDAVAELVERVACLADDLPELDTLLINPALASREGAWVVDVTAHVRPAPEPADAVRRLV
jgi:acyl-CoA synthetase (NDP forming)